MPPKPAVGFPGKGDRAGFFGEAVAVIRTKLVEIRDWRAKPAGRVISISDL